MAFESIPVWNRKTQALEPEKVMGERWIRLAYQNPVGFWFTRQVLTQRWVSQAFGALQSMRLSARKIPRFVSDFSIDMGEFEPGPFATFNDFFIRRFNEGARPFNPDPNVLSAFAEGRYFVFQDIQPDTMLPLKGTNVDPLHFLEDTSLAQYFLGGSCVIARLCPVDYHRFHFPLDGQALREHRIAGRLHSVNPIAMEAEEEVFLKNERVITLVDTPAFGKVALVEVGALCVGKIVQTYYPNGRPPAIDRPIPVKRGQEKGYFLFGGSTVVMLLPKGSVRFDLDLLKHSREGVEVLVRLGDRIGVKP